MPKKNTVIEVKIRRGCGCDWCQDHYDEIRVTHVDGSVNWHTFRRYRIPIKEIATAFEQDPSWRITFEKTGDNRDRERIWVFERIG